MKKISFKIKIVKFVESIDAFEEYLIEITSIDVQELANECGSQALNPNELGAVLKVLSLLAVEFEADTAANLSTVRVGGFTTAWQACSICSILGSERSATNSTLSSKVCNARGFRFIT